ncbi:hypothetical protein CJP74_02750 [Psittacicella melopsittaci]|uniref:Uncharacterized protein n=1 Tax=Psittacicella melopsittaci TaxID=2028576 RepID=A0A3A1Y6C6_9GAMM|nr:hypothetical protein [Psittacicella melopsittaci]RIY33061.1 hypothetical protein CJP74_02750 [Psittacicella melopsittaci]
MKVPAYLLNKFYLDNASDVRQAGHMMLSFIFSFEDNCEVIFLNKGFLNLIDITNISKLQKLQENHKEVYDYIWGNYLPADFRKKEFTTHLIERCKTLYTQWLLITYEYENENPIKFVVSEDFVDASILNKILDLVEEGELDLFQNIEFARENLSSSQLQEKLDSYKWVYKA